jgi:HigB_toxin, RelE-like toxic component of a toxin-antitoxin system
LIGKIIGVNILSKVKTKNLGNKKLIAAIDKLLNDLQNNEFKTFEELKALRKDADKVHSKGACFFNIHIHRTMILIQFGPEGEAEIL